MIKSRNPDIVHMSFEINRSDNETITNDKSEPVSHSTRIFPSSF